VIHAHLNAPKRCRDPWRQGCHTRQRELTVGAGAMWLGA
jgi:hypothetical protein